MKSKKIQVSRQQIVVGGEGHHCRHDHCPSTAWWEVPHLAFESEKKRVWNRLSIRDNGLYGHKAMCEFQDLDLSFTKSFMLFSSMASRAIVNSRGAIMARFERLLSFAQAVLYTQPARGWSYTDICGGSENKQSFGLCAKNLKEQLAGNVLVPNDDWAECLGDRDVAS